MEIRAVGAQAQQSRSECRSVPEQPRDSVEIGARRDVPRLLPRPVQQAAPGRPAPRTVPGYDRTYLDETVRPQDDFYRYAVGGYEKSHPIPDDKAYWGVRAELNQRIQDELKGLCEQAAARSGPRGSNEQKVGDLWASAMDEAAIERAGTRPIEPFFDRIAAIRTGGDVQETLGWLHRQGLGGLFGFGASQDNLEPGRMIGELGQGGLSLPDREYYLSADPDKAEIRQKFTDHVARMLELAGESPEQARESARTVLRVETRIAEGHLSKTELRDPQKTYNAMQPADLQALCPQFDWSAYFASQGCPDPGKLNVATPGYFEHMGKLLDEIPASDWSAYLKWQTTDELTGYLPDRFGAQSFEFNGRTLNGIPSRSPRWKRMLGLVDSTLGEALGQKFVEKNFPPEAKQRALDMVNNIKAVLRDRIANGWMSPETKKEALAKIDRLNVKIGYPDKWQDYSGLEISRGSFFDNVMASKSYYRDENLRRIGKPVDRSRWEMTPQTINAYYHPLLNEICFPAARLQPPFFDTRQDDAYNYGATGVTIGHEMTHGFDDSGAQFDSEGRMRNWWTDQDKATFDRMAQGVVQQMGEFTYDGQRNNGELVQGEAMADQGGLEVAHEALRRSLADHPVRSQDGFTPQQRFFLGYALCRQDSVRPEAAHMQMTNDPHPLGQFRVNGPLANMPAFHEAFGAGPGDAMVRPAEARNKLWDT